MGNDDHDDRAGGGRYLVQVLGPIAVTAPGGPVDPGGPKPRLLLALLLADPGRTVTTEQLIDGLWGDDPPATARKTVQVHVSNLRRSLGADFPLETSRAGYRIDPDQLTIDAVEFEHEVRSAEAGVEVDPVIAVDLLAAALARWHGPAYADVAEEPAIAPHAARLAELRLRAVEQRIDAELHLGRHERVLGELETLTVEHPYRERLRALQMLALYRSGRQTEALRAYERSRQVLADELGIDPGRELRTLHQQILEQSPELDLAADVGATRHEPVPQAASAVAAGPVELAPGVSVRGYELREVLGERAGGVMFRAYQPSVGREVALKVIGADRSNEAEFVKHFDASCRRQIELEHPHIVRVIDHWRDPSGAFVAMPLLGGGTLERALADGPLPVPSALQIIDQIGAALTHAHRRDIAHGDLRASNVLLDDAGNAYVADFLIAGDRPSGWAPGDGAVSGGASVAGDIEAVGHLASHMITGVPPDDIAYAPVRVPSTFGDVIRRAVEPDPSRRYERIDHLVRDIRRCFGADVVSTRAPIGTGETRNPYKGLRAFREADASDFFGRQALIDELIGRVRSSYLTVVVGPSGSGKSSLVHAGLVPAARRGELSRERDIVVAEMFPGAYPFDELATALLEVGVRRPPDLVEDLAADELGLVRAAKQVLPDDDTDLLLVVDQFEELFALTADESTRKRFIDVLAGAVREESRVRVVVTLRADFFGRPLSYPEFGALMRTSLVTVALPGDDELAEAIAEPARRVGLEIEPGLIPTILRDVADEPGSLPMLQYALTELADQRADDGLTIEAYRRTGGVVRAVATRAEEIYAGLPSAGRDAARALFVRLVSVSDEADDTRRRVRRSELDALGLAPAALQSAVDAFGSFRLLTFDHDPVTRGPTIEVAHEALIREWPRLRTWIEEHRDDLGTERRLASAVGEWRQSDYNPGLLISGIRLERYERWAESTRVRLTDDEESFIEQSRRRETERRRADSARRRRVLTLLSVLVAVAVAAAAVAVVQRNRANDEARAAEEQTRAATEAAATAEALRLESEAAAVATQARGLIGVALQATDPDVRVLLSLRAAEQLDGVAVVDPTVDSALYQSIVDHRIRARLVPSAPWPAHAFDDEANPEFLAYVAAGSPDGTTFVTSAIGGEVAVVADSETGAEIGRFEVESDQVAIIGSSWDWSTGDVVTGLSDGNLQIWRPDGELLDRIEVSTRAVWARPPDERAFAFLDLYDIRPGGYDIVRIDRDSGDELSRLRRRIDVIDEAVQAGRTAVRYSDGSIAIFDRRTWSDVTPERWLPEQNPPSVETIALEQSDRYAWLVIGSDLVRIDIETGAIVNQFSSQMAGVNTIEPLDGAERVVAFASGQPTAVVFDVETGSPAARLTLAAAAAPSEWEDYSVAAAGPDRLVLGMSNPITWEPGRPPGTIVSSGAPDRPTIVAAGAGDSLVVADADGTAVVLDSNGGRRASIESGSAQGGAVVSADGTTIVVSGRRAVRIIDVATGEVVATGPDGLVRPLGVSPDGSVAIVGTSLDADDTLQAIELIDTSTGSSAGRLGSLVEGVSADMSSDGSIAALPVTVVPRTFSAPSNSSVWLIDMVTGDVIRRGPPQECIVDAAFSNDDRFVATVGCDGNVSLFDVELLSGTASATARIGGTAALPTPGVGVVFGPDDDEVIVTREDGSVTSYRVDDEFSVAWTFDVGDHVGVPVVHDRELWLPAMGGPADLPSSKGIVIALPLDHDDLVEMARTTATRQLVDVECERFLGQTPCSPD